MTKSSELRVIFGEHLKNLRKAHKLTQAQLAEMSAVEPKHISCIENGLSFPSGDLIARLADALELHPYELFLFEEKPSVLELKNSIIEILNSTSDENIEKIYLYSKFIVSSDFSD